MQKKSKKTKEERVSEGFFPIDEDDLKKTIEIAIKEPVSQKQDVAKNTVEKSYSKPDRASLETIEEKPKRKYTRKKTSKRKILKKAKKTDKYIPKEINLKKQGYELIITEKPQAALKISAALGNAKTKNLKGINYYEVDREGKQIVVACAVGHLFTLSQNIFL